VKPPDAYPRASVVVVTRDRAPRLAALLASLERQSADRFEVIAVDDGSGDQTPSLLAERAAGGPYELRVIRADDRPGLAVLRNRGWRAATAPVVAFIDDDCEPAPGWLAELLAAAESNPGSFVQGRTVPIERELERSGPLTRTKLIEDAGPWFQTCNIAYPRALLEQLDGFDIRLRVVGEDTDLGWRAIAAGARPAYAPGALAAHAVEEIGFAGWLRIARRERLLGAVFARHPELRRSVTRLGAFKGYHGLVALAALGVAIGTRHRAGLLLVLPYARLLAARCRAANAGPAWALWFAAYDGFALSQSARGAIEHRVPLI